MPVRARERLPACAHASPRLCSARDACVIPGIPKWGLPGRRPEMQIQTGGTTTSIPSLGWAGLQRNLGRLSSPRRHQLGRRAAHRRASLRCAAPCCAAPTQECSCHGDLLLPPVAAMLCSGSVPRSAPPQPWLSPGSAAALGQHGVPFLHWEIE
eukprot:gene17225-biopygen14388